MVSKQGVLKERHVTEIYNFFLGVACTKRRLIEGTKRPLVDSLHMRKQNLVAAH